MKGAILIVYSALLLPAARKLSQHADAHILGLCPSNSCPLVWTVHSALETAVIR